MGAAPGQALALGAVTRRSLLSRVLSQLGVEHAVAVRVLAALGPAVDIAMGEDLITFLIHGADGAIGFVVLEGNGKSIGVGDLDGIAGGVVDQAAWNPHGYCFLGRALPDCKRGAVSGGPLRSHSLLGSPRLATGLRPFYRSKQSSHIDENACLQDLTPAFHDSNAT